MDEVMRALMEGDAFWRPETGEMVFYDEVFDEPPEGAGGTFRLSRVDLSRAHGDPWAGYNPGSDGPVSRLEAASAIASQPGWVRVRR